jgi:peptidoglycan/LPS O-acetylase OafA/YrhL
LHLQYRAEIDGLRAVAVVPVIIFHMGLNVGGYRLLPGGFIGVDVFFVISGFLIARILCDELQTGKLSFFGFYERRARRILPALFLVLICCLPPAWLLMDAVDLAELGWGLGAVSLFVSNILYWTRSGYFTQTAETDPLLHTWSLSVEEQFYVVFPLLIAIVWRFGVRAVTGTFLMLLLVSFYLAVSTQDRQTAFYWPQTRAWELLAGALLAVNFETVVRLRHNTVLAAIGSACGLAMILLATFFLDKNSTVPGFAALIPVVGSLLLLAFSGGGDVTSRLLKSKVAVGIGLLSYSLYLWHQPLFAFLRLYSIETPDYPLYLLAVCAALLLAMISYRLVEKPARNRQSGNGFTVAIVATLLTASMLAISATIITSQGFPQRWSEMHNNLSGYKNYDYQSLLRDRVCLLHPDQGFADLSGKCHATGRPIAVVWGDSHAATFFRSFSHYFGKSHVSQYTAARCPPVLDLEIFGVPQCRQFNARVLQEILDRPGSLVVLSANWSWYDPPAGVSFGYTSDDYWRHVEATLVELSKAGVRVVVTGGLPVWYPTLPQRLAKMLRIDGRVPVSIPLPVSPDVIGVDVRLQEVTRRAGYQFVSLVDGLCTNGECRVMVPARDGAEVLVQWDSAHPTREGARLIGRQVLGAIARE